MNKSKNLLEVTKMNKSKNLLEDILFFSDKISFNSVFLFNRDYVSYNGNISIFCFLHNIDALNSSLYNRLQTTLKQYYKIYDINKDITVVCDNIIKDRGKTGSFIDFINGFNHITKHNYYDDDEHISVFGKINRLFNKKYNEKIKEQEILNFINTMLKLKITRMLQCLNPVTRISELSLTLGSQHISIRSGSESVFEDSVIDAICYIKLYKNYLEYKNNTRRLT